MGMMRIGISVLSHKGQNIWQNGLGQNAIFLAQAFQRMPFVQSVLLIDVGSEGRLPDQVDCVAPDLPVITQREATDCVDVVIEMAGALDVAWLDLMRARGHKVVYYCCGQPYVQLVETTIFGRPVHASRPDRCDEIWIVSKDQQHIPMMRTLHRCPVNIVPYIWHQGFLEARIKDVFEYGFEYGYRSNRSALKRPAGLQVAIFEPNISVVKSSSIPMLACDEAYRASRESVASMHVLNTLHLKDHLTMLYMANSLDIVRDHRATFHGRHDVVGFMSQFANAAIAHQWDNDQNYSYLDLLYGGYPLIHNSPWLERFGAGYYYPGFDARVAGQQLAGAAHMHDVHLNAYRARARAVFESVDPFSTYNLEAYARRLQALVSNGKAMELA